MILFQAIPKAEPVKKLWPFKPYVLKKVIAFTFKLY